MKPFNITFDEFMDIAETVITVDRDEVLKSFDEAPWTEPRELPDGTKATPISKDQFSTPEEWLQFVEAHERAHTVIARKPNEPLGVYEDRINKLALNSMDEQQFSVAANDIRGQMNALRQANDNYLDQIDEAKKHGCNVKIIDVLEPDWQEECDAYLI